MKKTLINYNHHYMCCALPLNAYKEIQEAVLGIYLKYKDDATSFQWTMSDECSDKLKTLYAKYPEEYKTKDDMQNEIAGANQISVEVYGDEDCNYWCETLADAKRVVNNKHLRNLTNNNE